MRKKTKKSIRNRISYRRFLNKINRQESKKRHYTGLLKFAQTVRIHAEIKGWNYDFSEIIKRKNRPPSYKHLKINFIDKILPPNFTLELTHCSSVISFINDLKTLGEKNQNINIVMTNVVELGEGAVSMLLSVINEISNRKVLIRGVKPKNPRALAVLERSGFFKYLKTNISKENRLSKNKILRTGNNETPKKELADEVKLAVETVSGSPARCPELYGGLFEMFRNSCDHAFKEGERVTWHLGVAHFEERNLVKFSFVDNGKGIIESLKITKRDKMLAFFQDDVDFLETAFMNGIKSRTGLEWRGKGLPTIFELLKDGVIKRLVVITNNVYLDFDKNLKKKLSVNFSGTYYYWEFDTTCTPSYFT